MLLIRGQGQANKDVDYPPEFNMFIDKQVLFKVEVSDGNIKKKYRNYAVKKASDDLSIIEQFMSKHNIKVLIVVSLYDQHPILAILCNHNN